MSETTAKAKIPPVFIVETINKIRAMFSKLEQKMAPPPVVLLEMICGSWISQSLGVVAKLGVADLISDTAVPVSELATKTGTQVEPLYRVLRALSTVGLFIEDENQEFRLTSLGECLRSNHPQSMRYMAIFQTQLNWKNWGALEYTLRTGANAAEHILGEKPFQYLAKNKDQAEIFDRAMVNISAMEVDAVVAAYNFSKYKVIADIGGGRGAFLSAILEAYPSLNGILYDLPYVIGAAPAHVKEWSARIDLRAGSFFEAIPAGADAYIMKHIIHDWSDAEAIQIMKNIRSVMAADSKLLLVEAVIPEPNVAHFSKFLDLEMLVVTTGKERTEEAFRELMKEAGFRLERVIPTVSMASVLEASPI